jgi:hypothetical protein
VYWICPLFEDKSKINSGMMPGKWNFFKWRWSLKKKAVRPKSMIK